MEKEKLELGMVFSFGGHPDIEYVIVCLDKDTATLERITQRSKSGNRHGCGYGWFENEGTRFIRKMRKKELACYMTSDPVCNIEKGIYKVLKNIDTLLMQPCLVEDEIISILKTEWDDDPVGNRKIHRLNVHFKQFGKEGAERISFHNTNKMACVHWFWENFRKININQ